MTHPFTWDVNCVYATNLIHIWHASFVRGTWLIDIRHDSSIWDMPHSHETWRIHSRHDSFVCLQTYIYTWHVSFVGGRDSYLYETWLVHLRHDSFVCLQTYTYTWRVSFICGTWLIFIWDMTHACETWLLHMRHDPFICHETYWYVTCHQTHSHVTCLVHKRRDNKFMCNTTLDVQIHVQHNSFATEIWRFHMWHDRIQ